MVFPFLFWFPQLRVFNEADDVARLRLFVSFFTPRCSIAHSFPTWRKPAFRIGWPMRWRKAHLCFCLGWPTKIATMLANHCCYLPFFFLSVLVPFLMNGPVVRMVAFTHGLAWYWTNDYVFHFCRCPTKHCEFHAGCQLFARNVWLALFSLRLIFISAILVIRSWSVMQLRLLVCFVCVFPFPQLQRSRFLVLPAILFCLVCVCLAWPERGNGCLCVLVANPETES